MHSAASPNNRELLDDLAAIVWEADPRTFQFLYVSRGAEALLGYSLQDWLSRPTFWIDLLHPDDRDAAVAECLGAVADGRDHDFEYRVVTADGSVRWLRDIVSVGCDAAGRAERLRGLMIDVTATRATEASRDQADRYRRVVVDHGLGLTAITDTSGAILFESPSMETVLGLSPGARKGHSVFEMTHPDDASLMKGLVAEASSGSEARAPVQLRCRYGDGSWHVLEAIGRRVEDAHGAMVVINARDVTDRLRLEEECRHSQKMEALARITGAVAHDFNNLLGVILGHIDLALNDDAGSGVRPELREIQRAAELGAAMIGQLMTLGGGPRHTVVVDVNSTLQTLGRILERLLGPVAMLGVDAQASQPRVRMEGGALEQVLINLIVNARDALRMGGRVNITTRNVRMAIPWAGHTVDAIRDFIEIEVADTGAGMAPEIRERIFDLYFTTKDGTRGTGLATVYAIVRDAGGNITVDTEPGKGTTFRIRIPVMRS